MEADKNPFPEIKLIDPLATAKRVFHFLFDHLQSEGMSSHNRGAAPMLDRELYDNPNQMRFDYGRDEQTL